MLEFVYFDAGGGHRTAALAMQSVIQEERRGWEVRLLNLQETLDSLDIFRRVTGLRLQDIYNLMLAKGWTLGSAHFLRFMHGIIRLLHRPAVRMMAKLWRQRAPDLVVSLIPNFNRVLFESLRQACPATPMVTVLTDLADYPPHFWIERQDQYFVCGTAKAGEQALALGHPPQRVFRTSGMILRPQFYRQQAASREAGLKNLALEVGVPTILVLFGGQGANVMESIARQLGDCRVRLQLILMCGKNEKLRARLARLRTRNRSVTVGFTPEVPRYMAMADLFIGKPGPGSISEALHMGLPVIVERNAWTLPQERYNADWINTEGVGLVLPTFSNIDSAVEELLGSMRLNEMRARAQSMSNRAVFEIPPMLQQILEARHR